MKTMGFWVITLATLITAVVTQGSSLEESPGYTKHVLLELCQYKGVAYVRDPDDPQCRYIACWDRHPYHMPCPPGMIVTPSFFWGDAYPCTERDYEDSCNVIKNIHQSRARKLQAAASEAITQRYTQPRARGHGYGSDNDRGGAVTRDSQGGSDRGRRQNAHAHSPESGNRMETLHGLGGMGSTGDSYYSATFYVDDATGNRRQVGDGSPRQRSHSDSPDAPTYEAEPPRRSTGSYSHVTSQGGFENPDVASTESNMAVKVTGFEVSDKVNF